MSAIVIAIIILCLSLSLSLCLPYKCFAKTVNIIIYLAMTMTIEGHEFRPQNFTPFPLIGPTEKQFAMQSNQRHSIPHLTLKLWPITVALQIVAHLLQRKPVAYLPA